ncbi:MAG: hypothetical protein SO016_14380 [Lachnospiraceae bacterium]|nr:hypothetical protein [Robinsoniella sp.]MDY3767855.1 hypothetical protein [Lachnospiraceae bacterium]
MDYQQYQQDPNFSNGWDQKPSRPRRSAMEIAAFSFSIISVLFMFFFPMTLVFIGLSILFALLSKGSDTKISSFAKLSILVSVVSLVAGGGSTASYLYRNWDAITQEVEYALDYLYDILENPDSYSDYNWLFDDPDFFKNPSQEFYDDYGDLIHDLYGNSPYYGTPDPMPHQSFSQPSSDII